MLKKIFITFTICMAFFVVCLWTGCSDEDKVVSQSGLEDQYDTRFTFDDLPTIHNLDDPDTADSTSDIITITESEDTTYVIDPPDKYDDDDDNYTN